MIFLVDRQSEYCGDTKTENRKKFQVVTCLAYSVTAIADKKEILITLLVI